MINTKQIIMSAVRILILKPRFRKLKSSLRRLEPLGSSLSLNFKTIFNFKPNFNFKTQAVICLCHICILDFGRNTLDPSLLRRESNLLNHCLWTLIRVLGLKTYRVLNTALVSSSRKMLIALIT